MIIVHGRATSRNVRRGMWAFAKPGRTGRRETPAFAGVMAGIRPLRHSRGKANTAGNGREIPVFAGVTVGIRPLRHSREAGILL
ncbi:MAG TPA: hypothetical protein VFJ13_05305 [Paracoccaceae bacterium]|nr:hypothetical protein [Paracoccaceae bacterium]